MKYLVWTAERRFFFQPKTKNFLHKKATLSLKDVHLAELQEKLTAQEAADVKVAAEAATVVQGHNIRRFAADAAVKQRFPLNQKATGPYTVLLVTGVR